MAAPYQSSVGMQTTPLSGASAADFGAAAGQGISQAGQVVEDLAARERAINRDQQAAQAGVDFANATTKLDAAAIDARNNAGPGGAGHAQAVSQMIDDQAAQQLATIKDPRIKSEFSQRWADLKQQLFGREYGWQEGQRIEKLTNDIDTMGTTLADGQASNPNADGFALSQRTISTAINNMDLPDNLKQKLILEQQRKVALGFGGSIADKNPQLLVGDEKSGTKGLLDAGTLNPFLKEEDIQQLRSAADVEIRRQEVEARQKFDLAKSNWLQGVDVLKKRLAAGDPTVTDQEIETAAAGATTFSDPSVGFDIAEAKMQRDVAKQYRTATPAQIHSDIDALETKVAKGTATTEDAMRLKDLQSIAPSLVDRFNKDPHTAAAAAGNPAPEVDFNEQDPAKLQAEAQSRVQWAQAYRRATGLTYTPYLNTDELNQFKARAAEGPAGQLQVAAELRDTFGPNPAAEIVRQIDPSNRDMQLMVGLHPRMAQLYSRGIDALKRDPKLAGEDATDADQLRQIFNEYAPAIPEDLKTPVWNAARNMMAGRADETGHTELTGDDLANSFRIFMQYAGGRLGGQTTSTPGGFLQWKSYDGTPGYAWLPQTMSADEAATRLGRAGKADWIKAAGGAPYYLGPDGKLEPLNDAQISKLNSYQLDTVNPGIYRLRGPDGGHVVTKTGQPWQFDIRTLP